MMPRMPRSSGVLPDLNDRLANLPGAVVAFSGGVDSSVLAEAAHRALGERVLAVTADSPSLARRELSAASALAAQRGWRHRVMATGEMDDPRYAANPTNRCYFCKTALFDRLAPLAAELGVPVLLGTVTDDLGDWRPGQAAATERGGRHPFVEAGMGKAAVRALARAFGLPTAAKPASACLASRLAYGVAVTPAALARVEHAEDFVLGLGFPVLRVRDLGGDAASVEVSPDDLPRLRPLTQLVVEELCGLGFASVSIDERGYRRGALNERAGIALPLVVAGEMAAELAG